MSDEFSYNTPALFFAEHGVVEEDVEKIETYFDGIHEVDTNCEVAKRETQTYEITKHETKTYTITEQEIYSYNGNEMDDIDNDHFYTPLKLEDEKMNPRYNMRKSMSMSCIPHVKDELDNLSEEVHNLKLTKNPDSSKKTLKIRHTLLSKNRAGSVSNLLKAKSQSKGNLSVSSRSYYGSTESVRSNDKYVSMAEAVSKFHRGTPVRFRSKPLNFQPVLGKSCGILPTTIPQSPRFATRDRVRSIHTLSSKELEEKEVEEMKKFKIKVKPVNAKIMQGPICPKVPVEKKPCTIVRPFDITEVTKKPAAIVEKPAEFHANPVPKSLFEPPKPIIKPHATTKAFTPKFSKRLQGRERKPVPMKSIPIAETAPSKLTKTQMQPFSFEKRDKQMMKHKEDFINRVLEEEKKAREFHARPVPKSVRSSPMKNRSNGSLCSTKSEDRAPTAPQFKARPATVLYKKPFEPEKPERLIDITYFELNTDRRSRQREEFEQKKREREEMMVMAAREREEEQLLREEEEKARFRKEAIHKAHPIRHYKQFVIKPSDKPLTDAISPNFATDLLRNKENNHPNN